MKRDFGQDFVGISYRIMPQLAVSKYILALKVCVLMIIIYSVNYCCIMFNGKYSYRLIAYINFREVRLSE